MMRLLAFVMALMLVTVPLTSLRDKPRVDYGESELYSDRDVDRAVRTVMETFDTWRGCRMYSLEYAGDGRCLSEVEYCNSLADGADFDQCMVLESVFRSPVRGGGAWEANRIYTWSFILAREGNGPWVLLTWGYA